MNTKNMLLLLYLFPSSFLFDEWYMICGYGYRNLKKVLFSVPITLGLGLLFKEKSYIRMHSIG